MKQLEKKMLSLSELLTNADTNPNSMYEPIILARSVDNPFSKRLCYSETKLPLQSSPDFNQNRKRELKLTLERIPQINLLVRAHDLTLGDGFMPSKLQQNYRRKDCFSPGYLWDSEHAWSICFH